MEVRVDQVFLVSAYIAKDPAAVLSYVVVADHQEDVNTFMEKTIPDIVLVGITSLNVIRDTEKRIRASIDQLPGSWPLYIAKDPEERGTSL
jgi:hypothetical protein